MHANCVKDPKEKVINYQTTLPEVTSGDIGLEFARKWPCGFYGVGSGTAKDSVSCPVGFVYPMKQGICNTSGADGHHLELGLAVIKPRRGSLHSMMSTQTNYQMKNNIQS